MTASLMATFIVFSRVNIGQVVSLEEGKHEVAQACTKADGKEQPTIEGHSYEHEDVAPPNLYHVQY